MIDDRIKENKCATCGDVKIAEIALRTLQGTVKAQEKRIKELLKENHALREREFSQKPLTYELIKKAFELHRKKGVH